MRTCTEKIAGTMMVQALVRKQWQGNVGGPCCPTFATYARARAHSCWYAEPAVHVRATTTLPQGPLYSTLLSSSFLFAFFSSRPSLSPTNEDVTRCPR